MFQWLKNLFQTAPKPVSNTEILARIVELEGEWESFLVMQRKLAARANKRIKDEAKHEQQGFDAPEVNLKDPKAHLRALAAQRGLFNHRRGA